jgi:signal transduction histidine kinase
VPKDSGQSGTVAEAGDAGLVGWRRVVTALRRLAGSLSGKLLALTLLFVMLAEILIFVPSVANHRVNWLADRLTAAQLAALVAEAFPGGAIPDSLRAQLLRTAQVKAVAIKRNNLRVSILPPEMEGTIDATYDLRASVRPPGIWSDLTARFQLIADAIAVMFRNDDRMVRVIGEPNMAPGSFVEIVLPEEQLRQAMLRYGLNVLGLSALISIITAALVYFALKALFVRPMQRITESMLHFSGNPEDASRIIVPSARSDEIGTAERELAHMQGELKQMLVQKNHLAALGTAVSKISHDLRNMLASAQLLSDRLAALPDPTVQRVAPKLIASLDRAINFCNDTLRFGRHAETAPKREMVPLKTLVLEVGEGLGLPRESGIAWAVDVSDAVRVDADRDHLYRVLNNLVRNAVQAIEAQGSRVEEGRVRVVGERRGAKVVIDCIDTGPGVPEVAKANLFKAFQGSTRRGGTGLGLAIAHELVVAHGGTLVLVDAPDGTVFRIEIPDRAAGG